MKQLKIIAKSVISFLLCIIIVLCTIGPVEVQAADSAGNYYTHSPLLSGDTVAIDELNPWELECFGIFMSNFCIPFVDTYVTAFSTSAGTGSKGAGLQALQFATGGDVYSDSIVRRMVTMILDELVSNTRPLIVENFAINGNINGQLSNKSTVIDTSSTEQGVQYREAYLADLLPLIHFVDAGQSSLTEGASGIAPFNYDAYPKSVWNHAWVAGITSTNKDSGKQSTYTDLTITHGVLGKFYIGKSDNSMEIAYGEPIFDMTNGWDIQIPSNCLLYALYRDNGAYNANIKRLLDNADKIPLRMDSIGNICAFVDGQLTMIIPAYLNQHLIGEGTGTINLLGSVFINSLCSSTDKLTIAAGTVGVRANHNNAIEDQMPMLNAGLGQLVYNGSTVKPGTSYLYNIYTDYIAQSLYGNFRRIDVTAYNNFINAGLDTENHLRWSTGVKFTASDSFSILDYTSSTTPGDGNYSQAASAQDFTYEAVWKKVYDSANSDICEAASAFQTAAQLYTANTTTGLTDIKCYYKTLRDGKSENLLAGIDNLTKHADKSMLVYVPCGGDVSGAIHKLFSYGDADKWQNTYKQLAMLAVDLYHGVTPIELTAIQKSNIRSSIESLSIDKWIMKDILEKDGGKNLYQYITGTDEIPSKFKSDKFESSGWKTCEVINVQWARIAPATAYLKTAASYLGLHTDCTFSLYASDMYYSYLDIYGLLGENSVLFKKEVFEAFNSICVDPNVTAEELGKRIMTQGLTAEQKEQVLKENTYLMLSQDEDGREYRSRMIEGMFNGWLIRVYDNICYGDTESDYFKTLNSTSTSFLNLRTYSENFLTKAIVKNWPTVLPVLILILSLIITVFGTINHKKLPWILCNLIICTCMMITLPAVAETVPYVVEKISDTAFNNVIDTMAVSEAVEDDVIKADIKKQFAGYGDKIATAVDSLSAMGTSGSLMLKQDITRKVIPSTTSDVYSQLKGLASAQWLLPNLLSMISADTKETANDYVYRSLGEKRMELRRMKPDISQISSATDSINTARAKYGNTEIDISALANRSNIYTSASRGSTSYEHMYGLILTDLNATPVDINQANFAVITESLLASLSTYSDDNYATFVGYLQGTETLLPYFYLVAKDALKNVSNNILFEQVTMQDYYNAIKHTSETQHTNTLTVSDGYTIDALDLEYLFDAYIPYLLYMQDTAKEVLGDEKIKNAYKIYADEPKNFLYECNWADKIYNAYNYSEEELNPSSSLYANRTNGMIFSECQLKNSGLDAKQLTDIELACIEVNKQVDKAWTLLVNYIAVDGVSMDILAEQMAITATIIFNNVVSQDRVVSSNYALYPSAISLRTINFDTMMKMVLMSNYGLGDFNQNSMRIILAESGLPSAILLLITAWLATVLTPIAMDLCLAAVFYTAILACVYNACIDGKEKLKTFGGASISVFIITVETAIYVYSYAWIIGDTNKVLSATKMAAGNSLAVGKLILLFLITVVYIVLLIFHTVTGVKNFKDMSFQMWASYSQKTFTAATNAVKKIRSKISDAKDKLVAPTTPSSLNPGMPIEVSMSNKEKLKIDNSEKNPLFTKETNSADESTFILWSSDDDADDSGHVLRKPTDTSDTLQDSDKKETKNNGSNGSNSSNNNSGNNNDSANKE